jgi:hypothetical protein
MMHIQRSHQKLSGSGTVKRPMALKRDFGGQLNILRIAKSICA